MTLPPRYKIRVRTFNQWEEHPTRTKKETDELFTSLVKWDAPRDRVYVEVQDSGPKRENFRPISWCYLNEELQKASRVSPQRVQETFKKLQQEWQEGKKDQ